MDSDVAGQAINGWDILVVTAVFCLWATVRRLLLGRKDANGGGRRG